MTAVSGTVFAAFAVFSWGGSKSISTNFLDRIGVDTVNSMLPITCPITPKAESDVAAITAGGRNVCIRYENYRRWIRENRGPVDWERVRREVSEDLGRFAANPRWTMTLANSEVYPDSPLTAPARDPAIVAEARAAIGMEPDFGATLHDGLFEPTNQTAFACLRGVIGHAFLYVYGTAYRWMSAQALHRPKTPAVHCRHFWANDAHWHKNCE